MTTKPDPDAATLRAAAERAITALEQLPDGSPYAESLDVAERAVDALAGHARREIFPVALEPAGDLIAEFTFHTELVSRAGYGREVAALHGACLAGHPRLAAFLRSQAVRARVAASAEARAVVVARAAGEVTAEAVVAYERMIAAQLHGRGEFLPWCEILAVGVPALAARLQTARTMHEDRARAAAERVRTEHEAAERVLEQARQDRRHALLERAAHVHHVVLPGDVYVTTGGALRTLIGAAEEHELDRLERAVAAAEAAQGAVR